jgi:hypothetical protein
LDHFPRGCAPERTEQTGKSDTFQQVAFAGTVRTDKKYIAVMKNQFPRREVAEIGQFQRFDYHRQVTFYGSA